MPLPNDKLSSGLRAGPARRVRERGCFPAKLVLALWLLGGLPPAAADVLLDWTGLMLDTIRIEDSAPTLASRNLAILHTAVFDAVNSIVRTHQPYRFFPDPPAGASMEAAALASAYEVITGLYPATRGRAEELYLLSLSTLTASPAITNGLGFGAAIGRAALEARGSDGAATDLPYIPSEVPGQWRRTPPFFRPPVDPQWRYVEPFCLPELEPFVPPGPPALNSERYARDFNQVKALGAKNSATRTAEQSQIATFWSDFSYTVTPPGHWQEVAMTLARDHGNTLPENARLFAWLSLAQADAAIVCWEAKYRYNSWRPITAIQRADEDGNPATEKDASWASFLVAPSFPEHTSGHSTFSKASAVILTRFFGTDALSFTVGSDSLPGVFRSYTSVAACADEIGMSRIYGGIHFMSANVDGKICGGRIADFVARNFLLANAQLPCVVPEGVAAGRPRLRLHGHPGRTLVVETSTDLIRWRPLSTNIATPGGVLIVDRQGLAQGSSFYRALER